MSLNEESKFAESNENYFGSPIKYKDDDLSSGYYSGEKTYSTYYELSTVDSIETSLSNSKFSLFGSPDKLKEVSPIKLWSIMSPTTKTEGTERRLFIIKRKHLRRRE